MVYAVGVIIWLLAFTIVGTYVQEWFDERL